MLRIAAVVVTYNRKRMLLRCLDCLLGQKEAHCDILVVDNASTDGTAEALSSYRKNRRIYYCNTGRNLGGAGGFSFGMREAVQRGYEGIWAMDDDALPEPDALSKLLDADAKLAGNYGFLCSAVYWKDGSLCRMNRPRTGLCRKLADYTPGLKPVIMASFVSFLSAALPSRESGFLFPSSLFGRMIWNIPDESPARQNATQFRKAVFCTPWIPTLWWALKRTLRRGYGGTNIFIAMKFMFFEEKGSLAGFIFGPESAFTLSAYCALTLPADLKNSKLFGLLSFPDSLFIRKFLQ